MARRQVIEKDGAIPLTLKELRTRLGIIQDDVAQVLGVHRDSISKMESGMTRVSVRYIPMLAQLYDVDVATVVRACVPQNGHREEVPARPLRQSRWEKRVRKVLQELMALEKEKE